MEANSESRGHNTPKKKKKNKYLVTMGGEKKYCVVIAIKGWLIENPKNIIISLYTYIKNDWIHDI